MAISAGQVFVDLGARLDRSEFERYEKHLKDVQQRVAHKERFKAELGANYNERAFRSYQRDLDRAERETHKMVGAQARLRTAFGSVWARGGAAFAVAGGVAGIVAGAKGAVAAASDINESLTKNKTLFGAYARDVEKFSKQSADAFGISRSAALEYTGVFGNLSRAIGISEKDSARMSVRLTKLAADLASFNNTSIEDALEALRSGLVGETEPLRRFGVTLSAAAVNAEAMRSGLVKVSHSSLEYREAVIDLEKRQEAAAKALKEHGKTSLEFRDAQIEVEKANKAVTKAAAGGKVELTNQQKAMATTNLIFRQTSAAQGDFSKTSQGAANQQRILRARLSDMQAEIGDKLLPALVKGTQSLNKFIDGMRNGRGAGGQFAAALRTVGRALNRFGEDFNSNERQVGGWISGFGRAESTILKFTGTLIGGRAGDQLRQWGRNVDRNADAIDRWRQKLRVTREVDKIGDDIDRLRRRTRGSLGDIENDTDRNMRSIRRHMTLESAAGQRELGRNFRAAVSAIRRAMRDGRVSTEAGLAAIRRLMLRELRTLGISSAQREGRPLEASPGITNAQDSGAPLSPNPPNRYMGGWLGGRGLVGHDSIPAMLAPGEAVLNRHQQAVIESMLGDGFLDRLFAQVNRPHFMAQGGRARRFFARGGDSGGRFLQLPENIHRTHDTDGLAGYPAEDIFASPGTPVGAPVSGVIARLSGQAGGPGGGKAFGYSIYENGSNGRSYFLTHFGSTAVRVGQHVRRGQVIGTVADYPGGVPDHIHEGVHGGLTGITAGGPSGIPAAVWEAIKAPRTALTGVLGDVVQGTLDRTTRLANQRGRALARTVAASDPGGRGVVGPTGGRTSAGGRYNKAALAALWRRAGGPANVANIMAAIALAESSGNPSIVNRIGASGLWQIHPPEPGVLDPLTNARIAVRKWRERGFQPWEAYTNGNYRQFMQRGGFARFARGGKASKLAKTVGGATAGLIRKISPLQTDRSERFERLMGHVEAWDQDYSRWERRFNVTDEELVDADTGQVNVNAVKRKAHELARLIAIRHRIEDELEKARVVVKNIIHSYRRVITSLRRSLRHAKRKDRKGIESYVNQYEGRVNEWQGKLGEVGDSLFDTRTDLLELRKERREVLATTAEVRDTGGDFGDFGGDTGGGDIGGADIGADTATPDTPETPTAPTPLQIAEAVAAEMRTFLTGRQELLTSFGRNFVTPAAAGGVFGAPDALTASAGLRAFGGASGGGGLGGATIINNYHQLPDSTQTWSEQMRFIVGG